MFGGVAAEEESGAIKRARAVTMKHLENLFR